VILIFRWYQQPSSKPKYNPWRVSHTESGWWGSLTASEASFPKKESNVWIWFDWSNPTCFFQNCLLSPRMIVNKWRHIIHLINNTKLWSFYINFKTFPSTIMKQSWAEIWLETSHFDNFGLSINFIPNITNKIFNFDSF